ncbi:hypothetical protein [Pedobacter sp. ASV28]|uniref:hypothetical protein n=1 Tax=Pedobacter sp. ASV28 TaxID=2795123 RepID=UPI0018EDF3CD|nr:hypothetical protein [Pedobacter sp. ASV28]
MEKATLTPTENSGHLNALVALLVEKFSPLQVYQYAWATQREQLGSTFLGERRQEEEIFYLLLITEGTACIENEIQQYADSSYKGARAIVHAHAEATLRQNVANTNYYFCSVLNRGQLLYSANGLAGPNMVPMPRPERRLKMAKQHWKHRRAMAMGFLVAAERSIEEGHESVSVFLLYQVAEQVCIGLIWVFMGYKTDVRNLRRLLYVCGCFSKEPLRHFMGTAENEELLSLIIKGYVETRHQDGFMLECSLAYRFLALVEGFLELANGMCQKKFVEMRAALNQVAEQAAIEVVMETAGQNHHKEFIPFI